jgi:spore germination cell wall hydrolase CwlJ-like protein
MPSLARDHKVAGISRELQCLADNIYYEARGESFKGKLAVAVVTLNRVGLPQYSSSICGVVYQKNQFSWTRTKLKITDFYAWTDSLLAANMAMEDSKVLGNFEATHYHSTDINPGWKLRKVAKIGKHQFYS